MNTVNEAFSTYLKSSGYSLTKQRQYVFNLLVDKEPMSMQELIKLSKDKIDRASMYRIVDLFEKLGIVQRLNIGWKYKIELTDKFAEHHHHLTCTKCGKIIPINERSLEKFIGDVANQYSFNANSHQIEIQGLCETCVAG
jgi:Fur family ferric uptake transcriptional regulator